MKTDIYTTKHEKTRFTQIKKSAFAINDDPA